MRSGPALRDRWTQDRLRGSNRHVDARKALRSEAAGSGDGRRNRLRGLAEEVSFLGSIVRTRVRAGDTAVSFDAPNS